MASHESIKRVLNPDGGQNAGVFLLSGAMAGVLGCCYKSVGCCENKIADHGNAG